MNFVSKNNEPSNFSKCPEYNKRNESIQYFANCDPLCWKGWKDSGKENHYQMEKQPPSHQEDDDAKSDTKSEERNIQGDVLPDEGAADQVVQDCTQQPVQATSIHTTKPGNLEPEKKGYNLVGLVWWWRRMKKIEMTWERNVVKRRNEIVSRATFSRNSRHL
jgi:hypothetical protein